MRKLHKKYIVLNIFLIIYIMSLSVGYAYFSESIQAKGTTRQVYIRVSYKSQGTTRYMYFYYNFNVV